jgi:hypothetical protein
MKWYIFDSGLFMIKIKAKAFSCFRTKAINIVYFDICSNILTKYVEDKGR